MLQKQQMEIQIFARYFIRILILAWRGNICRQMELNVRLALRILIVWAEHTRLMKQQRRAQQPAPAEHIRPLVRPVHHSVLRVTHVRLGNICRKIQQYAYRVQMVTLAVAERIV